MNTATKNGVAELGIASDFDALFPGSHHFISYYSGNKGQPTWNSRIGLHGRYVLTARFHVRFDSNRIHPTRSGEVRFHLTELADIREHGNGYTSRQIRFGMPEWERLLESDGDFEVVGYPMITNEPLEGFEEAWKSS